MIFVIMIFIIMIFIIVIFIAIHSPSPYPGRVKSTHSFDHNKSGRGLKEPMSIFSNSPRS